jgi:glycosyltransferase involved in cell wall biosynthesis
MQQSAPSSGIGVSVVVPVYRNAETLYELHARLTAELAGTREPHELIFVNDASPDKSAAVLRGLKRRDPCVVVIELPNNIGQHRAVLAGLQRAAGRRVVVLDADLQDPPEAIPQLLAGLDGGAAVVFAGRCGHYESSTRLLTSRLFKTLLSLLCGVPRDAGMFVAMQHSVVAQVLSFKTRWPFVVAMIGCTGREAISIPVTRMQRRVGRTAYSSWGRLQAGLKAVACVLSCRLFARRAPVPQDRVSPAAEAPCPKS